MKSVICTMCVLAGAIAHAAGPAQTSARNPHLQTILGLFKAGKLDQAENELRLARAYEGNTSADLGQLAILDGMLRAVSAEDEQARAAFRRALMLNPQATLPDVATARIRKMFDEIRVEARAVASNLRSTASSAAPSHGPGSTRNFPAEFERHCSAGKLDAARALLDAAGARKDLTVIESGQILVLQGLLVVFQTLQQGAAPEVYRSLADDLEVVEAKMAEETAAARLTEAESAQFLALRGTLLLLRGMLRVESGEESRARASLRKALEINPRARLPPFASSRARRLLDETRAGR